MDAITVAIAPDQITYHRRPEDAEVDGEVAVAVIAIDSYIRLAVGSQLDQATDDVEALLGAVVIVVKIAVRKNTRLKWPAGKRECTGTAAIP
ncbi:MAG: hypothetical protein ACK44M_00540 [Chloroflexus sp.]